jgi:hypothetical protein
MYNKNILLQQSSSQKVKIQNIVLDNYLTNKPKEELSHCPICLESFSFVDEVEVCDFCQKEACSYCRCNCN